ncbi:MAG: prepilin-type N-terminal cleavage/methylation domain-containing protein [Firmicutes bacterium]|jgi:prepilin-type N-terminal cleavage/methylation domain-containing protein|nr:prepilin-type N-terminal cleavage/methylation domain-containing protein [Bacillota bacterium]
MGDKGFTMLEVLIVLLLLAIVAALAVPAVAALSTWQLQAAVREMVSDMREVRETAITHGLTCSLVFYEIGGRYRLNLPGGTIWRELPQGVSYAAVNFLGVDGRPTLAFRYTGAPNRGGHLALIDQRGRKKYIIVTPVTGRVRVDDKPP